MQKCSYVQRGILFFLILLLIFLALGFFFQPVWYTWSHYDTTRGFYNEPNNTIEVIFIGASIVANGIIPMDLYRDYGICAYNLGLEQQPLLASYYWTEETYRLHGKTLNTVVLDTSVLRHTPREEIYRKNIDGMALSPIKYRAVRDYTTSFNEALSNLVPLFQFHDRWSSLTKTDFDKITNKPNDCLRGYGVSTLRYFDARTYDKLSVPNYYISDPVTEEELDESALYYLKKLITFCKDHDINLVLIKTPDIAYWTEDAHNAVQHISKEYGLSFLDFNFEPYIDEIAYNHATDSRDGQHLNFYGARKLTAYIGQYLVNHCTVTDVRNNPEYDFMKKELSDYEKNVLSEIDILQIADLKEMLNTVLLNPDYTTFIMAKDEASNALTDDLRMFLKERGFEMLSELTFRGSYYGIVDSGTVMREAMDVFNEETDSDKTLPDNDLEKAELIKCVVRPEELPIFEEGRLEDGTIYRITSGGYDLGNTASCKLDNVEYAPNKRGLNIVVYDKVKHKVIEKAVFDTYMSEKRDQGDLESALKEALDNNADFNDLSSGLQKLYLYNERCAEKQNISFLHWCLAENGSWQLLKAYMDKPNTRILIAVQDEASTALGDEGRKAFRELGLEQLAELGYRDSYIGIIENGIIVKEIKGHGDKPLSFSGREYAIISGGFDAGSVSSIVVSEEDYALHERGINIVVYDTEQKNVIDTAVFDTHSFGIDPTPVDIEWEAKR